MTGALAQLISLVSYGNAFLAGGSIRQEFYPENDVFKYCGSVKFVAFRKTFFFTKFKEEKAAGDPYKWFEQLKREKCRRLAIYFEGSKDQSQAPDHKLAGFVGGGGTWIIEAIYKKQSDFWSNNWTVGDKSAPGSKIWSVKYGATSWDQPVADVRFDVAEATAELDLRLAKIHAFAAAQQLQSWADVFERARKTLGSDDPGRDFYYADMIVKEDYSLPSQRLLFAAGFAWVFGGMGSWNDLAFDSDADSKMYDALSAALYAAINKGVIAAVNSTN